MNPSPEPEVEIIDLVDRAAGGGRREAIAEDSVLPLKHFKLSAQPFADSVNPQFFYRTEAHEEAFLAMKQCVEDHVSLGLTTAVSGTGKTLLTQVLLQELDPQRYHAILVLAYPGMARTALLKEILAELGVKEGAERAGIHRLIDAIQRRIVELFQRGVRLVIIIDEVHFLNVEALHLLRTLSNIEIPERKLVTVLLFGEQVFLTKMEHPTYRSIFSRMFARTEIRPLRRDEVEQYVKFRLLVAGGRPGLISPEALDPLTEASRGIPREINRICHNALALAARRGASGIGPELIGLIPPAMPLERRR